jgi:osmotically-inducible protein OsmY
MIRWMKRIYWIGIGIALGYLFDPDNGDKRRARLMDRARARAMLALDEAGKRVKNRTGRAKRRMQEELGEESIPPRDDQDLLQKVRSEAVGMVPGSLENVDVRVEDGVVSLIGESENVGLEDELVERIGQVNGVRDVRNELVPS